MSGTVERALASVLGGESTDTGASLLAADPSADDELRRHGERLVRLAWERGWQPADVVRLVRRDLRDPHVRLLAGLIAGETRRYERLPARWPAQLAEIADPAAGTGTGARAGTAAGAGEKPYRADRFSYATAVLELYLLLARLPAIEPVGPLPGAELLPLPEDGEPRMLTRIRALLAKAEATSYPPEAEALTAKAQELMARHSIDEAVLAERTRRGDVPGACRIGVDAPYETAKAILLDAVASANRCRSVWHDTYGFSVVVGFEPDLAGTELLYTSLLVQGMSAMTRAEAEQRAGGRRRTKTFRQSFLLAYAHRLGERLALATRRQSHDATADHPGLLPVLAARETAVAGRTDRMFPKTVATRVRAATDLDGWTHGTSAANAARVTPDGAAHAPQPRLRPRA
ncbi:DUF2786 domain-containing protein [Streptomyces paludis]|uniref:DUF2786 domain-containing protein n=1 Tax=Streptomyces paludis TaxID=2282738 RepID=A0A345HPD9_9ACTN|nr:DUF2786 domain-containing protein [Streptomyces paludis]AXG78563.1 DUF2786 domain-containing protein [Streptomyces paludis]